MSLCNGNVYINRSIISHSFNLHSNCFYEVGTLQAEGAASLEVPGKGGALYIILPGADSCFGGVGNGRVSSF